MKDPIEREDAIRVIERCRHRLEGNGDTYQIMLDMIQDIPSAEHLIYEEMEKADIEAKAYAKGFKEGLEARKQGEWIDRTKYIGFPEYECSVCHAYGQRWMTFCHNCGAKMKGAEDE